MRNRRTVLALLGGILAFALIAGAAASLGGITSGDLGADDGIVASCDTNGVTTSYTSAYSATGTAGYKVDDVTVGGISDNCDGQTMTVTLSGASDAELGTVTQAVPVAAAFTNVLDFSSQGVLSEAVTGVHVVISQ
ncbi:MAG TPA: hypothetical protein VNT54_04320 [Solirubrobacteraceae bacterium]|nr:hypothetical protein [Solirubrobacteraceae bacterium]